MPDYFIANRIRHRDPQESGPLKLPPSFDAFSGPDLVRQRLLLLSPETPPDAAIGIMRDAGFALFMHRAKEGISASSSKDMVPLFERALGGVLNERLREETEVIIAEIKSSSLETGGARVEFLAQRHKAAYCLSKAMLLSCP
jgi:hypothetical protein